MSLVGSLEDLSLADILQIASLSRKSGVLQLRSQFGEGRIVLRSGTVFAALLKGEPEDLRGIVLGAGLIDEARFDASVNESRRTELSLDEALCLNPGITRERIEKLRREQVERAAIEMFGWRSGEFSFEVGGEVDDRDAELLLDSGVNAEFLAIEAARIRDEHSVTEGDRSISAPSGAMDTEGDVTFSCDGMDGAPSHDAHEAMGLWSAQKADVDGEFDLETAPLRRCGPMSESGLREGPLLSRMIAIDPDLDALEWLKAVLTGMFSRIHIFQQWENGVARIQQYLGRGEVPVVLISSRWFPDGDRGSGDVADQVGRLRALAPRMPILVVGDDPPGSPTFPVGEQSDVVRRPASRLLADREAWSTLEGAGSDLRRQLRPWVEGLAPGGRRAPLEGPTGSGSAESAQDVALTRLVAFGKRLRETIDRGDVLSLTLLFAGEWLSRIAIFTVRDDVAVGLVQSGLAESGGPDDSELSDLCIPLADVDWFRRAVEDRRALRVRPETHQACPLLAVLGPEQPLEVFVAPIVVAGGVAALFYADAIPGDPPLSDTSVVEVALEQAGLALECNLSRRSLASD